MQANAALIEDLPQAPRVIDPVKSFMGIVGWVMSLARDRGMPGVVVGISGTDSILTFLACAKAYEMLGRGDRVIGVHYGAPFPPVDKTAEEAARILTINPSYRWVARAIVPWLQQQAPKAQVLVESGIDYNDDYQRWAALFRSSLNGISRTEMLTPEQGFWVAGTRNATEEALGTYSNISGAVSLQPIVGLWKSEVLKICQALGVPSLAIDKSRQVDCDCGRYDLAADHIEEVDFILMARQGQLSPAWLQANVEAELLGKLEAFVTDQIRYAAFKKEIPYLPSPAAVVAA